MLKTIDRLNIYFKRQTTPIFYYFIINLIKCISVVVILSMYLSIFILLWYIPYYIFNNTGYGFISLGLFLLFTYCYLSAKIKVDNENAQIEKILKDEV